MNQPTDERIAGIFAAIEKSPAFAQFTARLNEYVTECNRTGHVITPEERDCLNNIRFTACILGDTESYRALSDYVWEVNQERNPNQ